VQGVAHPCAAEHVLHGAGDVVADGLADLPGGGIERRPAEARSASGWLAVAVSESGSRNAVNRNRLANLRLTYSNVTARAVHRPRRHVVFETAIVSAAPFNVAVDCSQNLPSSPGVIVNRPQIVATQVGEMVLAP